MKLQHMQASVLLFFFFGIFAPLSYTQRQTQADASFQAKHQQALQLFEQGKRLEALPLLEELVQKNPADEEAVVALAASLVRHAATLTDQKAAAEERLRAKGLLEKSGSTSTLAQNLLQLLRALPSSGEIQFSENPAVEQAMRAGEAAFSQRDFDAAMKDYSRALELDPKNYAAALFIGNSFHRKDNFAKAAEWYEKAIHIDPNIETAYRYYAHMLVKEGNMARARAMLIHAAVAEPYNRIVWRDLWTWASVNQTKLDFAYAGVLPEPKDPKQDEPLVKIEIFPEQPKNLFDVWRAYHSVRARWKDGGKFKQHFPEEAAYRHSLAEETEALNAEIRDLESLRGDIETSELVTEDDSLRLLLQLHESGVLEPYVLFRLGDEGIANDYSAYRAEHRDKLEEYLDKFVVPPAPAKAESGPEKTKPGADKSSGRVISPQA